MITSTSDRTTHVSIFIDWDSVDNAVYELQCFSDASGEYLKSLIPLASKLSAKLLRVNQKGILVMKSVSQYFLLCALLLALSLALGCGEKDHSTQATTSATPKNTPVLNQIVIATFSKALGNLPYYVARDQGFFEKEPSLKDVKIQYSEFGDRSTISAAFDANSLHTLFSAEVPAILCRAQGNDIRIVQISAYANQDILVPNESAIQSIEQLKGKRIAVLQGTSSQYCLLKMLELAGIKESDVQLSYMKAPEAKSAFESGQLEAWAVWPPFTEQQEVSGRGRVIMGGDARINSVMSVPQKFIVDHPACVEALVSGISQAKKWATANPDKAKAIAAKYLELDPAVVDKAWPKFHWDEEMKPEILNDIQAKAKFLAEQDKTIHGVINVCA